MVRGAGWWPGECQQASFGFSSVESPLTLVSKPQAAVRVAAGLQGAEERVGGRLVHGLEWLEAEPEWTGRVSI